MENIKRKLRKISPIRIIPVVFLIIIFCGTFLLMLPISTKGPGGTGFSDSLFTATSATCVTGLIRFDTYTHWTVFGQLVILSMIQIGGIGFMTIALWFLSLTSHKIGLSSRLLMQNSISAPQMGGMVKMTQFIFAGTLLIESVGALFLAGVFVPKYGWGRGIYYAIFHSVSAFCNAGFDLMGEEEQFSSLVTMGGNWYLNLVIMALIVIGGLGFFVWKDLLDTKFRFRKLHLHSKIVVSMTAVLILGGAALLFLLEFKEVGTAGKPLNEQILNALFQSVSCRTAGFNTVDFNQMTEPSVYVMIGLMLIGGSPGSTAGGFKTTTFAILLVSIVSVFRRRKSEEIFKRRLDIDVMRTAACIYMIYMGLSGGAALLIAKLESIPMLTALFETSSAVGTVGLTMGITPEVGLVSKVILALLMYIGRVGSLTILMSFSSERNTIASKLPLEKVQLG